MVDLEIVGKNKKSRKRDKTQSHDSEPPAKKSKKNSKKTAKLDGNQYGSSTNEETFEEPESVSIPETVEDQISNPVKEKKKRKKSKKQDLNMSIESNNGEEQINNENEVLDENVEKPSDETVKDAKKKKKKSKTKEPNESEQSEIISKNPNDLSIEELEKRVLEIQNRPTVTKTGKRKLGSLKKILNIKKEKANTPTTDSEKIEELEESEKKPKESKGSTPQAKKKNSRFCVFVGNLPYTATKEIIQEHFSKTGDIIDVRIPPPKKGETKPRGFAYVELKDKHGYEKSLELHHSFLGGRRINVYYTTNNKNKNPEEQKKEIQKKNFKLSAMRNKGLFREENKTVLKS